MIKRDKLDRLGAAIAVGLSLLVVCRLTAACVARADDTPADSSGLDEIIITATRTPTRAFDSPYSADAVLADTIDRKMFRTLPEAMREIPGVMVQKTSLGQGSPFIRGFTGFHNLLLIDGIRLNNSVFRDGPNQYWGTLDPLSVARLEIVKGPGSVLYGSDAVGGTVHAIAKERYDASASRPVGGRAYYRTALAERSHIGHFEVAVGDGERVPAVYFDGSVKSFGDLQLGGSDGRQRDVGYDEYSVSFKARAELSPKLSVVAAHQTLEQNDVPRTHSTKYAVSFRGTEVGSDLRRDLNQRRHLSYLQLHGDALGTAVQKAKFSVSWHEQSEQEDRVRSSGSRRVQGMDVETLGLWTQLESSSAVGDLTYGTDYYHDKVNSHSSSNAIQGPVADDAAYDLFGAYIQDVVQASARLKLVLGGRFTYARAEADSVSDPITKERIAIRKDWNDFVGSVRALYEIVPDHLNGFAGVSQGFRAPNLSDLTRLDSARSGELETPSPDLEPEKFTSFELGLKGKLAGLSSQLSYYYMDIQDMIVRTPTGVIIDGESEVTKRNAGDGFVQGVEGELRWKPRPQWQFYGSLAWMDGKVETFPTSDPVVVKEPIDRLMPITGVAGARWEPRALGIWFEASALMVARQDRLSTRDKSDVQRIPPGGTPGYAVFSLSAGWRLSDDVTLTAALENLSDEPYRIHGSGTNEAGRNLVLSLDARI